MSWVSELPVSFEATSAGQLGQLYSHAAQGTALIPGEQMGAALMTANTDARGRQRWQGRAPC